jgi:prepilin-type N-terminal cleavage/methylation domain-containing protein
LVSFAERVDVRMLRRSSTLSEDMLWTLLRNRRLGVKFRRQQRLDRFVADFYCAESRLAVEVDGGVHEARRGADRERDVFFAQNGIRVFRVRADDVERDAEGVVHRIQSELARTPPLSTKLEWGPGGEVSSTRRAFTLLELSIALVLLGLMIAVAVPSFAAVSGARLRESTNIMAGAIRDTFARTALSGRSTRLVLDMEQEAWWVEETDGVARVKSTKLEANRDGKVALDAPDARLDGIEADTTDAKEQAKLALLAGPTFRPVEGEWGTPQKLPPDVRFKSVWVEHLEDKMIGGVVGLYFYPGGYTEEALITLTDDDEGSRTLTLAVQALTGEVFVESDEPRIPNVEGDA